MKNVLNFKDYYTVDACKMVIRVSAPFTEDDYCGKGKRPNTELARNSPFASRRSVCNQIPKYLSYSAV